MKIRTVPIFIFIFIIFLNTYIFGEKINNQTVITEEYVQKVIIEGKWGIDEGEFGIQHRFQEKDYVPTSLCVDSKENIYILDLVNNRIQKFDKKGKYVLSIPIDSFRGPVHSWLVRRFEEPYRGDWVEADKKPTGIESRNLRPQINSIKFIGKNIVIDSEDNLYYYCHKNVMITNQKGEWMKNPDAKGEVWQFKNDKLMEKGEVEIGDARNLWIDEEDTVWVGKNKIKENESVKKIKKEKPVKVKGGIVTPKGYIFKVDKKLKPENIVTIIFPDGKEVKKNITAKYLGKIELLGNNILIRIEGKYFRYDEKGRLISVIILPRRGERKNFGGKRIGVCWYDSFSGLTGGKFKLIKWEPKKKSK